MCARQHHAVMVGFVAVAVDQNDIGWFHQRLYDYLVGGRSTVGNKIGAFRSKCARRHYLRFLDRTMGLQ